MASKGKPQVKVVTNVKLGPASLAQKQAWRRFFQKLISEVKASEQ